MRIKMKITTLCMTFAVSGMFATSLSAEEVKKPHATIIVGTHHYSPQLTMPKLSDELKRLGFDVSLINPEWDAERDKRGLPGLEVLKETDVAVFFVRWLKLEGEQYKQMMDYVEAGKPVVCLRTSNHAFKYPKGHENEPLNIDFGKDAFGTPYRIHLGGSTNMEVIESAKDDPILTGVSGSWVSPGTLYLTKTEEGIKPLIQGTGKSKGGKTEIKENIYGKHELKAEMTDSVAWTWKNKWGGKAFSTSLGHAGDFAVPQSMRVIVNGIHWAAGVPIPAADLEVKTFKVEEPAKAGKKKKKGKKKGKKGKKKAAN